MKAQKKLTAEIVNPEALQYAEDTFTKLLFEFYMENLEKGKEIRKSTEDK